MSNNSSLSKRAALRQQQELEERNKKTKRIVGAGVGLLALTAVVVLVIVIIQAISAPANKPVATDQLTLSLDHVEESLMALVETRRGGPRQPGRDQAGT